MTAEEVKVKCTLMTVAYAEYEDKAAELCRQEQGLAADRAVLSNDTSQLLVSRDPKSLGANEEQRKAAISIHLRDQEKIVQSREQSLILLKGEVEIARIRCRAHDNTLRYLELLNNLKEGP